MNSLSVVSRQNLESSNLNSGSDAGGAVAKSLEIIFNEYDEKRAEIERISNFVNGKHELVAYFLSGNKMHSFIAESLFESKGAIAALNSAYWSKAIKMTDVLDCMPADERNKWGKSIEDMTTPDFNRETVIPTLQNLLLQRETFLAQKVDGLFRKLSGNHVTNSPAGFSKRMIVEYVLDSWGLSSHRVEYLHDLRAIIAKLMGRDSNLKSYSTRESLDLLYRDGKFGEWVEFDGGALKIKLFKKGTAHMEVHPEIARSLNNILSTLYPNAIPSNHRKKDPGTKEIPLKRDILPFEILNHLGSALDSIRRNKNHLYLVTSEIPHDIYDKVSEVFSYIGGKEESDKKNPRYVTWNFEYAASDVLATVIRTGALPEKVSHQFYPTKKALAELVVDLAGITDADSILEPSAGQGGLADLLPKSQTSCVEISEVNASVLKAKGFKVTVGDFLKMDFQNKFTKIVMNPPFAKGAAELHLKKAASLLTDDGRLVAVLPGSLINKELVHGFTHEWTGAIEEAFDDTGIRVAVLVLTKD